MKMKKIFNKKKAVHIISLFLASSLVALLAHLFFLTEWFEGRYMTGIGDGLSQMLPFKKLLYDAYTSGNFFYSNQFGMGGGTYSQLGYYFSTSIVFLITVSITYILESIHLIRSPDLFYFADAILVISIIRMSLIISVTTLFFRYLNIRAIPAFIGALFYGTSVIYFRHVTYWEFFADAMLWLPLLLYGIEKIIKEKRATWFIIALSINLFDNFYFAYINFLVAGLYIMCRWFIPLAPSETNKFTQLKMYLLSGLAGFGISAVSFIPAVYGYLNNHRIPYEEPIPFLGVPDNLLLDGRIIVLPAFVVLCLFMIHSYKNAHFKLFASLTILSVVLHFSPIVASIFNGFSAPQYRWEYFLSLVAGGVAATSLQHIHKITKRQVVISIICTLAVYVTFYITHGAIFSNLGMNFSLFTPEVAYLALAAVITISFFALYGWKKSRNTLAILSLTLVVISIYTSNLYQIIKLPQAGSSKEVSKDLMLSNEYNGKDQLELLNKIKEQESDPFYRIDWMIETRNNTPIVQDFNGFSVYSSILNKHLLYYYLYDLEIDMGRESVSRYSTLGNRANLYSILQGKYYITEKGDHAIPYQFDKIFSSGDYVAYKNRNILPFLRPTSTTFNRNDFLDASPINKERAMIEGIILDPNDIKDKSISIPESVNRMNDVDILATGATYMGNHLTVNDEVGGIDLLLKDSNADQKDYYVSFNLRRLDQDKGYNLSVNEYSTSRKKNTSIYKTGVEKVTVRIAGDERIAIRLPKGHYQLSDLELYEEDYKLLHAARAKSDLKNDIPINWTGNKIKISYDNERTEDYATIPVPFEKGWTVRINGQKTELLQANYAFIGFLLQDGENEIELIYYPPYFFISLFITAFSLLLTFILFVKQRKKPII